MRDEVTKRERGYKDPRSKVRPTGEEALYGKDWAKRKAELWERAEGRCERFVSAAEPMTHAGGQSVQRCRSEGTEPDHKVKRSKKRDDRLENLQLLCHLHHELKHPEKNKLHWSKR